MDRRDFSADHVPYRDLSLPVNGTLLAEISGPQIIDNAGPGFSVVGP